MCFEGRGAIGKMPCGASAWLVTHKKWAQSYSAHLKISQSHAFSKSTVPLFLYIPIFLSMGIKLYVYIYIQYIYMCVCVCVCACVNFDIDILLHNDAFSNSSLIF